MHCHNSLPAVLKCGMLHTSEWVVPDLPLHTQVFPAEHERGAVLLAHGYAEHLGRYEHLIGRLGSAGFTVYTYDQRGHGRSKGQRAVVDVHQLVDDHLKLRESLRGLKVPLFAFGHSAGGLITAASVLQDPRGLRGVILSSPALLVGENESAFTKKLSGVLAKVLPGLPVTDLPAGGISRVADEVSRYQNDPDIYHGKVPALTVATMLQLSASLSDKLGTWQVPTLLLHGDADQLAAVEGSRRFAQHAGKKAVPAPVIRYHEFAGGYHELFNDEVRAEVEELTIDWLNEQLENQKGDDQR